MTATFERILRSLLATTLLWAIATSASASFVVQVGAYASSRNAATVVSRLRKAGFPVTAQTPPGGPLIKVTVGPYSTRSTARQAQKRLAGAGWRGFVRSVAGKPASEESLPRSGTTPASAAKAARTPKDTTTQSEKAPPGPGGSGIAGLFAPEPAGKPAPSASSDTKGKGIAGLFKQTPPAQKTSTGSGKGKGIGGLFESQTAKPAPSLFGARPIRPHGFFLSRLAYTYPAPGHWSLFQNLLKAGVEHRGDTLSWKLSGWVSYDPVYANSDFYPPAVRENQRFDAMVRESYLDLSAGNWDFRMGRQQIVWGEMVGLFFADVVSALDLRQFVAQDFDLIRIPQWAVRAEYFKGNFHGEAVWIPYMSYDKIGKPGADFYPYPLPPPPGYRMAIEGEHKPHGWSDGAYGLRMGYLLHDWDLTAFYYNSMNRAPTFFRTVVTSPTPTVVYRPDHTRIQQIGGTLSKAYSNSVLKAEAVYTRNQYYNVRNLTNPNGVVKQNTLDYAIGLDYSLPQSSRVDVQFYQRWFINHNPDIIPDRFESGISLLASREFMDQTVKPEILLIHSLNRDGWMIRPQVSWTFQTNWRAAVGADIFHGPRTGLFGQYDNADRVYAQVRYAY